jgi:hypothetical protein
VCTGTPGAISPIRHSCKHISICVYADCRVHTSGVHTVWTGSRKQKADYMTVGLRDSTLYTGDCILYTIGLHIGGGRWG